MSRKEVKLAKHALCENFALQENGPKSQTQSRFSWALLRHRCHNMMYSGEGVTFIPLAVLFQRLSLLLLMRERERVR